jgi:hypothetical protein
VLHFKPGILTQPESVGQGFIDLSLKFSVAQIPVFEIAQMPA